METSLSQDQHSVNSLSNALRVLMVEDSEDDAFLIKWELRRGGYDVTLKRVDTSLHFNKALDMEEWDVVISDYNIPGFNGLAALQLLKDKNIDLPFILVSGAIGEEVAVEAMKAGAQDYIKKDNLSRLIPAVERELREAHIRRERMYVQEMLNESEARYRTLVENIPIGIFRITPGIGGLIYMANPAFINMFGLNQNEPLSKYRISDFFADPEGEEQFHEQLKISGKVNNLELNMKKKDGSLLCGSLTARSGYDESSKFSFIDCTIEDISERKQSENIQNVIFEISQAANTAQSLEDLLIHFHQAIQKLMPANNFYLAFYDADTKTINYPYFVDEFDSTPAPHFLRKGLTDYVLTTGLPLLVSPEVFNRLVEQKAVESFGTPSLDWLGVPLKTSENKTIGALVVQTYDEGIRYTERDLDVLTFVAAQTAMAVENRRVAEALRASDSEQRALLEAIPDLILVCDPKGKILDFRIPEWASELIHPDYIGRYITETLPDSITQNLLHMLQTTLDRGSMQQAEFTIQIPGALSKHTYEVRMSAVRPDRLILIIRDVTEAKRAAKQIEGQRLFLRQIIDTNPDFIFAKDHEGRFTLANQAVADAYGITVEELLGKTDADFNSKTAEVEAFRQDDLDVILNQTEKVIPEEIITYSNGQTHWLQTVKRPLTIAETGEVQVLGVSTDITARKRAEEQLIHNAFHDSLTGLPNRALFLDRLGRAMERYKRHPKPFMAVLLLDFDRFALINDSLGHAVGDHLLIAASSRLASCLRSMDTIARIGGDEFLILLEDLVSVSDATIIANRILEEMAIPFNLLGQKVVMTTSIGIVLASSSYESPEEILRDADIAMNRAKQQGRSRYTLFSNTMRADVVAHLELGTDLRQAIEKKELFLQYQPVIDLVTGKPIGFEALIRWKHPERGLVQPLEFIRFAEETGLIIPMSEWVLTESCTQLKKWHEQYPCLRNLSVSVNISNKQFTQPTLVNQIKNILNITGLNPSFLRLEITESAIMENPDITITALKELKEVGIKVDIDDFGTGYSSLLYLHMLPLNAIKIDRSFIGGSDDKENGMQIVHSIIRLAQDLKMETVAEGVETVEQLTKLRNLGCNHIQGFIFSTAIDDSDVLTFTSQKMLEIENICQQLIN
jgi:diguanylate cyclase (GGDEF)-like protein/PAS domain S-box-containing protein